MTSPDVGGNFPYCSLMRSSREALYRWKAGPCSFNQLIDVGILSRLDGTAFIGCTGCETL